MRGTTTPLDDAENGDDFLVRLYATVFTTHPDLRPSLHLLVRYKGIDCLP